MSLSSKTPLRARSPPKYYTEIALALKYEYEALETHELQEGGFLTRLRIQSIQRRKPVCFVRSDVLLSNVHAAWR